MRLVCLIADGPDGIAFANRIHAALGVDLAIVPHPPRMRKIVHKFRSSGVHGVSDAMRERVRGRLHAARRERDCNRWLGDEWRSLSSGIPTLRTGSVNDQVVIERVAALGEVILLVHSDVIIGDELLQKCSSGLNLHWGLSPYYRGIRCTEWALLHWDPYNLGVTLHHLTNEIDGGAIIGQARARIEPGDTVHSINTQLTSLGTAIAIDAARAIRGGADLSGTPQDLAMGFLTYSRQWSGQLGRHVARLERSSLERMLAAPSRGALPIVELDRGAHVDA